MLFNNRSSGVIWLVIVLLLSPGISFAQDFTFSIDVPTDLNGTHYLAHQTVLHSGALYSLDFDLSVVGMVDNVNINAIAELPSGNLIFSTDAPFFDGLMWYEARDIVMWDGFTTTMYQPGAPLGLMEGANINALAVNGTGDILLSFDAPVDLGVISFEPCDIAQIDTGLLVMLFQGQMNGMLPSSNICGLELDCTGNYLFNFDAPINLSGTWYHPTEIVQYDGMNYSMYFSAPMWPLTSGMTDFYIAGGGATLAPFNDSPVCEGVQVHFSANRTGGTSPYSYIWDFGDGTGNSTNENPNYTYTSPGTYTASVQLVDGSGCPAGPEITIVTINQDPVAGFTWFDNADCTVSFTDMTAAGSSPYTYAWDFGDGSGTSTAQNPVYTYTANGPYAVALDIIDSNGCMSSFIEPGVTVTGCGTSVSANPVNSGPVCYDSQPVSFSANPAGGVSPYTYAWDFGDGAGTSTECNPMYSYTATGTYTACVIVTDSMLISSPLDCTSVEVISGPSSVYTAMPFPPCEVAYTSTISGGTPPLTYFWDFGDGIGTSTEMHPTYTYTVSGTFTTLLTVTDSNGCTDISTNNLTTNADCLVFASPWSLRPTCFQEMASFKANPSGGKTPYTFSWDFGDGMGTSTHENPSYLYGAPGTYTICVTVTDDYGQSSGAICMNMNVNGLPMASIVTNDPVCDGERVDFTSNPSGGETPYLFTWNFGDGVGSSTVEDPSYTYAIPGTYSVELTISGFTGVENFKEKRILVPSDGANYDSYGTSIAIDGNRAVIGASYADSGGDDRGQAYVRYKDQGGTDNWGEVKVLTASDGADGDLFGYSVAISGDYIVVGACGSISGQGQAYVFYKDQGGTDNWGQVKILTEPDTSFFGDSVTIDGANIIVGTAGFDSGKAYIFNRNYGGADNWGKIKTLIPSEVTDSDYYGNTVALKGEYAFVSAPVADSAGALNCGKVFIYKKDLGGIDNWGELKIVKASNPELDTQFGQAVSLFGDMALIGSSSEQAYILSKDLGGIDNWGELKRLTPSDGSNDDRFGESVSIYADYAVVGSWRADAGGSDNGQAYVFGKDSGGIGNWGEMEILKASDSSPSDYFGYAVATNGSDVVIGAESAKAGSMSGKAYMYQWEEDPPCQNVITVDIVVNEIPEPNPSNDGPGCANTGIQFWANAMLGTPPYTYSWDFGDATGTSTEENPVYTYASPGFYSACLTLTDSAGCVSIPACTDISVTGPESSPSNDGPACTFELINFTANPSGGVTPYTFFWNFGDGSGTSNLENPSYSYASSGSYTVILSVTGFDGCWSVNNTMAVVSSNPGASPSTDGSGCVLDPVNFTASPYGGISPYTYNWDFDDGMGTSTERNPSYSYASAGTYNACVTITDSVGCSGAWHCTSVNVFDKPTAAPTNDSPGCGTICFASNPSLGTPPYTFSWDFGDGIGTSTTENPCYTYGSSGSYLAAVTVTDSRNCSMTMDTPVSVQPTPTSSPVNDGPVCIFDTINFTANPAGGVSPYTFAWDFGDGMGTSNQENPWYSYSSAGSYTVTLQVTGFDGCFSINSVIAIAGAKPSVSPNSDTPGCTNSPVNFTAGPVGGTPPYTFVWDFGDGSGTSTEENPSYTYAAPGSYDACVDVFDAYGCSGAIVCTGVNIYNPPTIAPTNNGPECLGNSVTFSANPSGGAMPYSFSWDFGDSLGTSIDENPTYTYGSAGTYTACLTVTDNRGCTSTSVCTFPVINDNPFTVVNLDNQTDCALEFSSTDSGGMPPYSYSWDFGDGSGSSTSPNPVYTYAGSGTYVVSLELTDANGCISNDVLPVSCSLSTPPPEIVPDGEDVPGTPVTVEKVGSDISFVCDNVSNATAYNLYRGTLGTWYSHNTKVTEELCQGSPDTVIIDISDPVTDGNNYYYLINATNGVCESSFGFDSTNASREAGAFWPGQACFGSCP